MAPIAIQAELVKGHHPATLLYSEFYSTTTSYSNPTLITTTTTTTSTASTTTASTTTDGNKKESATLDFIDVDSTTASWDILTCFSMMLLWLQGVVTALRSLVVANDDHNDENETTPVSGPRKYFLLLQSLLLGNSAAIATCTACASSPNSLCHVHHHHKQVVNDGSWPPPGLVALAILTVVALVVHPDGMTWIMLRKIRDTMVSILQSSTTCWAIMIRDYGVVVGTVSASASIILVLIVAIAMHKAFLSNCVAHHKNNSGTAATSSTKRRSSGAEKKRRRRKGKNNARGRIKTAGNSSSNANNNALRLPKVEEVASDGASRSSSGDVNVVHSPAPAPPTSTSCFEEGSIMTSPSALESVVSSDETCDTAKLRTPVPSVCTVDTTSMSDDISCSSFSVRSGQQQQQPTPRSNRAVVTSPPKGKGKSAAAKTNSNGKTKGQKQGKAGGGKLPPPAPNAARAEALKMAKPVPKFTMTDNRFGNQYSSKQTAAAPAAAKGTYSAQNARATRGAKGKKAVTNKAQPAPPKAARTVSPVPTTFDSTLLVSTTPSPRANNATTVISGSPVIASPSLNTERNNLTLISGHATNSNDENNSRLPPFSPYSQSLFSCEIGASSWSLPALPVVLQPTKVGATSSITPAPAQSYTTGNPFVTSYSQMPTGPRTESDGLGLWNTSTRTAAPPMNQLGSMSTPKRPVRPPPGLSAPPGFARVPQQLQQPALTNNHSTASDLFTPVRNNNELPSLVPSTPSTTCTIPEPSPFSWNNAPLVPGGFHSESPMMMMMSAPVNQKNPFAGDTSNKNNNGVASNADEVECRIEAELQELGGRMIGSVLDF
ncbi:expressed unknown protein [Seminavis robusta]|uniref:Uncharacterized protein n=1 Tax=Seminavis robusta TaxID=568900 RepID=A0A9N8DVQ5_9STRA|nr:expressed unknown protein [Seminavis robusta]|eukprot:Sro311_g114310.1 n/a (831) ;mRNA; f:44835-47626